MDSTDSTFNWALFRLAFEAVGGRVIDRSTDHNTSFKVLGSHCNFSNGGLELMITFNQASYLSTPPQHILKFPKSVVLLNIELSEGEVLGKVLQIEVVAASTDDEYTLLGGYQVLIDGHRIKFY